MALVFFAALCIATILLLHFAPHLLPKVFTTAKSYIVAGCIAGAAVSSLLFVCLLYKSQSKQEIPHISRDKLHLKDLPDLPKMSRQGDQPQETKKGSPPPFSPISQPVNCMISQVGYGYQNFFCEETEEAILLAEGNAINDSMKYFTRYMADHADEGLGKKLAGAFEITFTLQPSNSKMDWFVYFDKKTGHLYFPKDFLTATGTNPFILSTSPANLKTKTYRARTGNAVVELPEEKEFKLRRAVLSAGYTFYVCQGNDVPRIAKMKPDPYIKVVIT